MTFNEFRNGLCILISLDCDELVEAGVIKDDHDLAHPGSAWREFRADPYRETLRLDDERSKCLWALMKKRGVTGSADARDITGETR